MLYTQSTNDIEYESHLGESFYQLGYRIIWRLQGGKSYVLKVMPKAIAPFGSSYYELLLDGSIGPCISYNYNSAD